MGMSRIHEYQPDEKLAIGEASRVTGVSISTLRRWEREGRITPLRTLGGQRRYLFRELEDLVDVYPARTA